MKKTMFVDWCNNKQGGINPLDYFVGYELPEGEEIVVKARDEQDMILYSLTGKENGNVLNLKDIDIGNTAKDYWWRCSKCNIYFQSTIRNIYKNNNDVVCRDCNNYKEDEAHLSDWLQSHNNLEVTGALIYKHRASININGCIPKAKDGKAETDKIVPINPYSIGTGSGKKVVIRCRRHNYYKLITVRDICKRSEATYGLKCCATDINLWEWCLLFYYKVFTVSKPVKLENQNMDYEHEKYYTGEDVFYNYSDGKNDADICDNPPSILSYELCNFECGLSFTFSASIHKVVCGRQWCDNVECLKCSDEDKIKSLEPEWQNGEYTLLDFSNKTKALINEVGLLKDNLDKREAEVSDVDNALENVKLIIRGNKKLHKLISSICVIENTSNNKTNKKVIKLLIAAITQFVKDKKDDVARMQLMDVDKWYLIIPPKMSGSTNDGFYLMSYEDSETTLKNINNNKDDFVCEFAVLDTSKLTKYKDEIESELPFLILDSEIKCAVREKAYDVRLGSLFTTVRKIRNPEIINLHIPATVKNINFAGCNIEGNLDIPMFILGKQLNVTGHVRKRVYKSGGLAFMYENNSNKKGYIGFMNFFKAGETWRIYADKICLYYDKDNREETLISGFRWSKFYESEDELARCLIMSKHEIIRVPDISSALVDIYNKRG